MGRGLPRLEPFQRKAVLDDRQITDKRAAVGETSLGLTVARVITRQTRRRVQLRWSLAILAFTLERPSSRRCTMPRAWR